MAEEVMDNSFAGESAIIVNNVSKKFKDVYAVNNVSLRIAKNTIFGLLGSNGAGKSTMMHLLTGLLNSNSGEIIILGKKVKNSYSRFLKERVAIVPQEISLYDELTIYDNLYFFGKAYVSNSRELKERIDFLKGILQLGDLGRKVKHLSGGYQRRVSLAAALLGNPEILILDEALVGIDLETKKIILDLLIELKKSKTIVFATHSMEEAQQICDNVCFMHKGVKIKEGSTRAILEEFATHHGSTIIITFDDEETAKEVSDGIESKRVNVKLEGKVIRIESLSSEYDVSNIINFIKDIGEYKDRIIELEIAKPTLGDVMLELIRRGAS